MKFCIIVAIGIVWSTTVPALAESPIRFQDEESGTAEVSMFCGEDKRQFYLGQVGDYFALDGCNTIEFRVAREGVLKSLLLLHVKELFDPSALNWTLILQRPVCHPVRGNEVVTISNNSPNSRPVARGRWVDKSTLTFPIRVLVEGLGGESSCMAKIFQVMRPFQRYRWDGEISSQPSGAAIMHVDGELGQTTCNVALKFFGSNEEQIITLRKAGYVNKPVKINKDSVKRIHIVLDESPPSPGKK